MLNIEDTAKRIADLENETNDYYSQGKSTFYFDEELKTIGQTLYDQGGEDLMREALTKATHLGMTGRYVERLWTGIGSWMG